MSNFNVHETYIHAAVKIIYELLPTDEGFPEQIDIQRVVLDRENKGRPVELLSSLTESDVLALEDEVLEARRTNHA